MAIPIIAGVAAGAGAIALGTTLTVAFAVGSVVAMAASMLSTPTQGISNPKTPNTYVSDPTVLTFQGDVPRRLVYGSPRVSGVTVYANTAGEDNELAVLVIAIAAHEIQGVNGIWIDGKSGTDYGSKLAVEYMLGSDDQAANSYLVNLIPQWTFNHRLRGIAYAVVTMTYDKEVWSDGFPRNIQFDVLGKPVYDPRDGSTAWSCNPALNLYDYMMSDLGLSAVESDFSLQHVINAANRCEEVPPDNRASVCDGIFTCDGVIELTSSKQTIIEMFTTAMAGVVVWSEGQYQIFAGQILPVRGEIVTDQLAGPPKITPQASRDNTFNTVKGVFLDSSSGWTFTDFPPIIGDEYVLEDGESLVRDISLAMTKDSLTAQRLSTFFLRRERLDGTIVIPCNWSCYGYQVMDVVELTFDFLGWNKMLYQVTSWEFRLPSATDPGGVNLSLREYSDDLWSNDMDLLPSHGGGVIDKPDVTTVNPPTGLTLTSDLSTIDLLTQGARVLIEWHPHPNPYVRGYELWYRLKGDAEQIWISIPSSATTSYIFDALSGRQYEVGLRAATLFDTHSDTVEADITAYLGADIYPNDVEILTATLTGAPGEEPELQPQVNLTWQPVGNAVGYRIGFTTSDGIYTSVANVSGNVTVFLDQRKRFDGNYMAWALGPSGQYSINPAQAFVPASEIPLVTVLEATGLASFNLVGFDMYKGVKAVPKSTQMAADGEWDTFDYIVPEPIAHCSIWSKATHDADTNDYLEAGGILYYYTPGFNQDFLYPLVEVDGVGYRTFTFTEPKTVSVGVEFDTANFLAIFNDLDVYLGE